MAQGGRLTPRCLHCARARARSVSMMTPHECAPNVEREIETFEKLKQSCKMKAEGGEAPVIDRWVGQMSRGHDAKRRMEVTHAESNAALVACAEAIEEDVRVFG